MRELVLFDVAAKLAASLGVAEEDGGVPSFRDWPCQFRINRYNYTPETVGSPGVQAHTDSGFATVLQEDDSIGWLEVADRDTGEFAPVDAPVPGSLLVNIGDIATAWSNGALHNARHRVRCVAAVPRFTIAMFLLGPKDGEEVTPSLTLRRDTLDWPIAFRASSLGQSRPILWTARPPA